MAEFKVKPLHPSDAAEITVEADNMVVDNSSGRINFFTGTGESQACVGTFLNVTAYKVTPPAP